MSITPKNLIKLPLTYAFMNMLADILNTFYVSSQNFLFLILITFKL